MAAGALFLAFSVAPTEEMMLIAFRMGPGQSIALILLSILMLHALVYMVGFKGQQALEADLRSQGLGYHFHHATDLAARGQPQPDAGVGRERDLAGKIAGARRPIQ